MTVRDFFEAEGALSRCLPDYEPRPGQLALALRVEESLRTGGVLLAEAGTGIGKTLAYLMPAVESGKKVVVSTATKALQYQIVEKDLPLLARAVAKPLSAVLLKGRQNYLCLRRFEAFRARPLFRFTREAAIYDLLERWAGATLTGDRSELADLPDDYGPWREICSTAETCWGAKCPLDADCHFQRRRRSAQKAQVVVVNHHLFLADLAVRAASPGEVIPRYAAAVLDEAHQIEVIATQHFGTRISSHRVAELLRDAARVAGPETSATAGIAEAMADLDHCATEFWRQVPRSDQPARLKVAFQGEARLRLQRLLGAVGHLADRWAPHQAESVDSEAIQRRVEQLGEDLTGLLRDPAPGEVRWVDTRGRTVSLQTVPVHAAPALEQHLFRQGVAVVLTSATLSLDGSFDYLRERLGIPPAAAELVLDSPFDHACQGLLYIPRDLPDPREPGFAQAAAAQIQGLLAITRGRAFCLFTSHRALRQAAETLQEALPYPLLIQGEAPREVLLERFRREAGAVLLGAQSFWEGVDVPGDALSAVIIDKLPFASPSEPLTEARIEQLNAQGRSAFFSYQVPAAAMSLRQGAGRLLRRGTDRGIVAVLDTRLLTRAYGRYLRTCLPPFPMTRELSDVRAFFDHSSVS